MPIEITPGLHKTGVGAFELIRQADGSYLFLPIQTGTEDPTEPPVTTITNVSAPVIVPSDGTAPNEVPYDASFSLTDAVWSSEDADGDLQTSDVVSFNIEREWLLDDVVVSTSDTLAAGDNTRIGQTLRYRERAQDLVTGEWSAWVDAADITPIRDLDTTPLPGDSVALVEADWVMLPGRFVNLDGTDLDNPNPDPTVDKWVPRFGIKQSYHQDLALPSVQWGAGFADPIPASNWEPAEFVEELADGTYVYELSLRDKTGDRWDLVPRPSGATSVSFAVRAKFEETQDWAADSDKKDSIVPPPVVKPDAITGWTVVPHSSGDDGRITLTIPGGQPNSWGDGTPGTIQWANSVDGWATITSGTHDITLPQSLHGLNTDIRVRALSGDGIAGEETTQSVQVPGTVTAVQGWMPFGFIGQGASRDTGGDHYQFFQGGDVFYNPSHPDDGKIAAASMDAHALWVCGGFEGPWPVFASPELDGIRGRYGLGVKIDREQPNRMVILTSARAAGNPGGIWTSLDYARTIEYSTYSHSNSRVAGNFGLWIVGGQYGGGTSPWRAWHRLIQQSYTDPRDWIVVAPRRNYEGGDKGGFILRSTDRAQTWSYSGETLSQAFIYTVGQTADGKLLFGSEDGLHIANTFNGSFNSAVWPSGMTGADRKAIVGIECHPTDSRYGYLATLYGEIWRTDDGFSSVEKIGLRANGYVNVFASPWNFNNVWAIGVQNNKANNNNTRLSAFSSNGLRGAAGTGTSGSPSWTEISKAKNDTGVYGWPKDGGVAFINGPGYNARSDNQFQCGILPQKDAATNHKSGYAYYKGRMSHTSNGHDFTASGDGVDHTGAGHFDAYVFSTSKTHPEHSIFAGYDNTTKHCHDGWRRWIDSNRSEVTLCASIAPNRPNGDWAAGLSAYYTDGHISWTKNLNNAVPNWTSANAGTTRFVSFGQGPGGHKVLWSGTHRCTNFDGQSPSFQALTNSEGFNSNQRMFCVSAYDANVAFSVRNNRYIWRTTNKGASFTQFCDMGTSLSTGFWVDPKDHNVVYWFHPQQGLRKFEQGVGYSTPGPEIAGFSSGNVADRLRICPFTNTIYIYYANMSQGRFQMVRKVDNGTFEDISRYFPRVESVRGMDLCEVTGIVFQLGTVGTRYFPPVSGNAITTDRLDMLRAREAATNGAATRAIL